MPWSCLCSSNKERYRPHISAPILNTTNETQKTQLVPTGKRATLIATAQNLEQKLDATDNVGLENGEFRDKRAKQLNKKQKEKCNKNKSKPLNAKKQTKSIGENEKISKDLMNVKFAFNGITPEPTNSAARNAKRTESLNKCNEELINVVSVETPTDLTSADYNNKSIIIITQNLQHPTNKATEKSEAGDYDKLPLIKIDAAQDDECNAEENGNSTTRNLYNSTTKSCTTTMECNSDDTVQPHASTSFTKSSESIPFIDESPNRTMHKNYHEARFITIEPRNVGSRVNNANIHNSAAVAPFTIDDIVKEPQRFDKSVQILYQPDVAPLGDVHQFKKMDKLDGKLCQICHRSIYLINSMKCMGCGLVCHVDCAAIFKRKLRYSDACYIIFQQWEKGYDKVAFPTVHNYVQGGHTYKAANNLVNTDVKVNRKYLGAADTNKNTKRKRRSRSTERLTNKGVQPLIETDSDDEDLKSSEKTQQLNAALVLPTALHKLNKENERDENHVQPQETLQHNQQTKEPHNMTINSIPISQSVVVDVHQPKLSETISESDKQTDGSVTDTSDVVLRPKVNRDINGNTLDLKLIGRSDSGSKMHSTLKVPRKQFVQISDSSSFDESDGPDYATVQLRKNYDEQQQQQNQQQKQQQHIPKTQPYPRSPQKPDSSETILHYVTERILASVLPQRGNYDQSEHSERPHSETSREDKYEKELITMLEQKHGKDYKLFDLESCIATITLEKLCELCKHIDAWLGGGREKVIVLQDRGDRQRLGAAISAYLEYLEICGSTASRRNGTTLNEEARIQNAITKNWLDLDIFSMKKFLEELIGPLRIPSHRRYLNYFSGLLSGKIKMNSSPVYLKYVAVESPPSWLHYKADNAEWRSFIKVYDGLRCVFTSEIHVVPISTRRFIYQVDDLKLRGDVMIRCYQIVPSDRYGAERRELMSSTQFHTCAITNREMPFGRDELDYACDDPRFPEDHKVTFYFSNTASNDSDGYLFQSPLVTLEPATAITKYNSLEILDDDNQHTQGPLDGSLYATILKSPRTPTSTHSLKSQTLPNSNTPNLISPPPEFSNKRIDFTETHYSNGYLAASTTPSLRSSCSSTLSNRNTSTPIINKRASFNQDDIKISEHRDTSRPSSSLSSYTPDRYARSQSFTPNLGNYVPNTHQVKQIQSNEYTNSTVVNGNLHIASGDPNSYKEARESVRSPLTLSMDSGISSSGIVNRRIQGSSSSPSSFPSQTSPQEDRHRELDDILSDMLMTVQDIPDVNKNRYQTLTKAYNTSKSSSFGSLSSQQSRQSHQNHQQPQYHTDTIKRSQTCTTVQEELTPLQLSHPHNNNNNNYYKVDAYDTASTTTTLTPPPSESGRDTPLNIYDMHGQPPLPPHTSTSSSTSTLKRDNSFQASGKQQLAPNVIMDLQQHQQQSFVYPQQARSNHNTVVVETTTTTQEIDGDQIPYHAREDSRPFTYGNPSGVQLSPTGTGMIKMQSGLSSPSLVRRTLSPTSSLKKTPARNDFEEMLRERREKVLSEKYTISDKNASNGVNSAGSYNGDNRRDHSASYDYKTAYNDNSKWFNTASPSMKAQTASPTAAATNGYRYPEPLKRSNTMDGGFGRSNSIDGTSGQTWLQLQQQKLRAKKEQQLADNRDYYTRTINTEIRSRPARSRSSASQRYDGYASDTGAFSYDEVDFQRPLHVQTPNRSSGRNYHTMTTTTTNTVQNERPFVAVKRAHQQAVKQQTPIGSPPVSPLSILSASPHGHIAQAQAQETTKNGLLSIADNNNSSSRNGHVRLVREESFSSYRSETEPEMSTAGSPRPETPAFPVTPRTPYGFNNGHSSPALPPKSPLTHRRFLNNSTWSLRSQKSSYSTSDWSKDLYSGNQNANIHQVMNQNETLSCYNTSRRNSTSSNAHSEPQEVAPHLVKFVRDSSKYWYKPSISRDEAVGLLRNAPPGTFIVRDSTTFANAYGLVVKVSHPPPGVVPKNGDELVRHFLVEPTTRGVRLKGCANEPVFTSLSALVYQHSITPLALPCKLIVPDRDIMPNMVQQSPAQQQLQTQGAACNVLYLFTCETESLTGPEAVKKAVSVLYGRKPLPIPTEVHFKVSHQGITLTDNSRQLFFRKHYPVKNISFCGLDPDDRRWSVRVEGDIPVVNKSIFAFVARRGPSSNDNQCHVFCELDPHQPATAIAAYAGKVIGAGTYAVSRNI